MSPGGTDRYSSIVAKHCVLWASVAIVRGWIVGVIECYGVAPATAGDLSTRSYLKLHYGCYHGELPPTY